VTPHRHLALLLGLALAACPGGDTHIVSPDTAAPGDDTTAAVDSDATDDVTVPVDGAADADAPEVADTAGAVDADTAAVDGGPAPGTFGWPCHDNADCESDYCLEGYDGRVCSRSCETRCDDGWSCRQDLAKFPDIIFVCVPSFPTLCTPCDASAECHTGSDDSARCLPRDGERDLGAFCGGSCAAAPCPEGYVCASRPDVDGVVTPQCVPTDGACHCSPAAMASGASTQCAMQNDEGRCVGRMACGIEGLSSCDAQEPALDRCDGRDDDCDGETDEGHVLVGCTVTNALGSCVGVMACFGAQGVRCDAPEATAEVCGDGVDNDCDGTTDGEGGSGCVPYWRDVDEDGFGGGEARCLCHPEGEWVARVGGDCDDALPNVRPTAAEVCDGRDNDCNGGVDDPGAAGCSSFFADLDGDGYGADSGALCLCEADPETGYVAKTPTDCDDAAGDVHPGAAEVCNGVDDDCDTLVDEEGAGNCVLFFADDDEDGYGDPSRFSCRCGPTPSYPAALGGDCDDHDAGRNPGAAEACGGGDEDCDGAVDEADAEGCVTYYRDSDSDDYGLTADAQCLCAPSAPWDALVGGDCNDGAAAVHPGAAEACNGKDDDCDGVLDDAGASGCVDYWRDEDLDSFGVAGDAQCLCAPEVPYVAQNDTDCDDGNPFAHVGATEVCNQRDDDCDGETDEGVEATCTPFYYDADGDGWGVAGDSRCRCGPDGLYRAVNAGDCDDGAAEVHPYAHEVCGGTDEDCDGQTDEDGASGCVLYYRDADADGVGAYGDQRCLCAPAAPYAATSGGDCDEGDDQVHPGAPERCNDVDDDCDGAVDPAGSVGCTTYLRDADQDGFGVASEAQCLCAPVAPYTTLTPGDCNDADATMKPSALEVCNGKDDDCTGVIDDPGTTGCVTFYRDEDGDTWGDSAASSCRCSPGGAYTATTGGDCDDARASANPAVFEVCNFADDDCDGLVDEAGAAGCALRWRDVDGDGFGEASEVACLCEDAGVFRADVGGDCDDAAVMVNPGAAESCNGVDDDCNGVTDEEGALGCAEYLRDLDGDGYGDDAARRCLCAPSGAYATAVGGDCNDSAVLISPASDEFCNATDDDCDGVVDEEGAVGCQSFYTDVDGDGWGVGAGRCMCSAQGLWRASQAVDCDDDDALQNPALAERCGGDGRDEDCDGVVDEANAEGCVARFEDVDDDGFGVTLSETCLCGSVGDFTAASGGDCDDDVAAVSPAAVEVCNAVDDDCDGRIDEGCGMQVGGWPTAKGDARRSGHAKAVAGPATPTLRWKRQLTTAELVGSPTVDTAGNVVMAVGSTLFKLRPSDGASVWETALPAPMSAGASPTLRAGGTIVVPVGNGLALVGPDGAVLWHTAFPGPASEDITGSPLVDDEGTIYTVGYAFAYAVDPGGQILWSIAVPNLQYVPAHVGLGPTNGRIYFGCSNHALFAVERTGFVAWTFVVPDVDVDASVAIGEDGVIYQSFGNYVHRVVDYGAYGEGTHNANAQGDLDAHVAVWRDAGGLDHVLTNANGASGLRRFRGADLGAEWTFAATKDQSRNSTPIIDKDGVVYFGDDAGHFFAVTAAGTEKWRFATTAAGVDTEAALVSGAVIFGDDGGWLYYLASP